MLINEFDNFDSKSRKPWLLLLVLIVPVLIFGYRYVKSHRPEKPIVEEEIQNALSVAVDVQESSKQQDAIVVPVALSSDSSNVCVAPVAVKKLIASAKLLESANSPILAREKYLSVLDQQSTSKEMVAYAEKAIARINIELITTPVLSPEKEIYIIKRGDIAEKIVRKYGTTVELFMVSNKLKDANKIRIGDRMVVFTGKFSITVSKKRNDLVLFVNNRFFKRYSVGTGKYGKTPAGTFVVSDKDKEPVWWRNSKAVPYTGDPKGENILGTRWMTLRATGDTVDVRGYGIHGTWFEDSIGKAESAGCVRMRNKDVEELFMLLPLNTPVTIVE